MRNQLVCVHIRHWCEKPSRSNACITANTEEEAIAAWNHRATPPSLPIEYERADAAPPNSLPDWDECAMRVANSDFIAKRVAEGGHGPEHDSKLATELHRFIYEYDDADPYRSAWFLHRLEKLINEIKTNASLPIDFKQASELLAMFGGEAGMVSLQIGGGHSGRGLYAHASSYPEEGAVFLGVADEEAVPSAAPKQASEQGGWLPIATAPKGCNVLVGYWNRLGKWRTVKACYYPSQTLELHEDHDWDQDGDGFAPEGWYEETETHEVTLPLECEPVRWMHLPPSPHPEEGALLLGGDEGGKKGGAK